MKVGHAIRTREVTTAERMARFWSLIGNVEMFSFTSLPIWRAGALPMTADPKTADAPNEGDLFRQINGGLCRFICYASDDNTGADLVIFRIEGDTAVRVLPRSQWEEIVWDNAGTTSQPRFTCVQ